MSKPNIILILVDQMRGDCMGADGHTFIETPNLDYLAASGTRFRHAYTASPSPAAGVVAPWFIRAPRDRRSGGSIHINKRPDPG